MPGSRRAGRPIQPVIILHPAQGRQQIERGSFMIERMRPGLDWPVAADPGLGPLGLVDHAVLTGGTSVPLHEHRDDEIFSYLRRGTLYHTDSTGRHEALTPNRLMLMNSGSGLSHEETVPWGGETVEMLQVFVRPRARHLSPRIQISHLPLARSENDWRLLAAPENDVSRPAALFFRSAVEFHDAHFSAGASFQAPTRPGYDLWLYVFSGEITAGAQTLRTGGAATFLDESPPPLRAALASDLVCILLDRSAPFTRSGTRSGSVPPEISGRRVTLHS